MKSSAVAILLSLFLGCLIYQFSAAYGYQLLIDYAARIGNVKTAKALNELLVLVGTLVFIFCIMGIVVFSTHASTKPKYRHPKSSPTRLRQQSAARPTAPPRPAQPQPKPTAQSHRQSELHRQLVGLLHGDAGKAQRLLDLSIEKNPSKGVVWNLEKVIYDLVRDRGG